MLGHMTIALERYAKNLSRQPSEIKDNMFSPGVSTQYDKKYETVIPSRISSQNPPDTHDKNA